MTIMKNIQTLSLKQKLRINKSMQKSLKNYFPYIVYIKYGLRKVT